jgi:hypothetical protein
MNVHDSHIQAFHGYHNLLGKEILNENPNNYAINNDVVKGRELPGKRNNHRGPSYRNSGGLAYMGSSLKYRNAFGQHIQKT